MNENENKQSKGPSSAKDLHKFLKEKGSNHTGGYYHYTNIEALKGMLKSRKLHLSIGSEMNDQLEIQKGSKKAWKKTYVASFSFGNHENMAMWGIYGEPLADALRIKFKLKSLRDRINELKCSGTNRSGLYKVKGKSDYETLDEKFSIELIDVVYLSHKDHGNTLYWNNEMLHGSRHKFVNDSHEKSTFAGCLKNVAWKYENETRILVKFENELKDVKKIAFKIDDALNDIEVLCGPCLEEDYLLDVLDSLKIKKINESQSLGKIYMRNKCNLCELEDRCCPREKNN